jgi:hypothetical protein
VFWGVRRLRREPRDGDDPGNRVWLKSPKINGVKGDIFSLRRSYNVLTTALKMPEKTRKMRVKNPSLRFFSCAR